MSFGETIVELASRVTPIDMIIFAGWVLIFGSWLIRTSLGTKALADSIPRRNDMPPYTPFIPLFVWFGTLWIAGTIVKAILPNLSDWQEGFVDHILLGASAIVGIAVIISTVKVHFARRLKGFGLNIKTIPKDLVFAFVNLVAVWPIVHLAVVVMLVVGKLVWGPGYEMEQHQAIETITTHGQLSLRVSIFIVAVVIAPLLEEMLFRGLFQTMIRSWSAKPWLSILISSGLFAIVHPNTGHWPPLFVLGVCLGYAYEKSGSLFRPIFIHSIFNTINLIGALNQ